jgi:hypothetical protein
MNAIARIDCKLPAGEREPELCLHRSPGGQRIGLPRPILGRGQVATVQRFWQGPAGPERQLAI